MIKVIDGKRYNTETAELVFWYTNGNMQTDFKYRSKKLYQDTSDDTYEAICDAIDREPQDDRYTGTGEITRPDGVYSWEITE